MASDALRTQARDLLREQGIAVTTERVDEIALLLDRRGTAGPAATAPAPVSRSGPDPRQAADIGGMIGGLTGTALGLAVGGRGGGTPGATAGAMAGGFLGNQLGRSSVNEFMGRPVTEGNVLDATFDVGANVLPGIGGAALKGGRRLLQKGLLGDATNRARNAMFEQAERLGIPLSAQELSDSRFAQSFGDVAAKFPFFGGAVRRAQAVRFAAVDTGWDQIVARSAGDAPPLAGVARRGTKEADAATLRAYAPTYAIDDLSIEAVKQSDNAFKQFKGESARLYEAAEKLALDTESVIPAGRIQAAAGELLSDLAQGPTRTTVKRARQPAGFASDAAPAAQPTKTTLTNDQFDMVKRVATEFRKLDDMDPIQWRRAIKLISSEITAAQKKGWDEVVNDLMQLKLAAKQSIDDMQGDVAAVQAFQDASAFYRDGMALFRDSRGAKLLTKGKTNPRGAGFSTATQFDDSTTLDFFFNNPNPATMKELRRNLIGTGTEGSATRQQGATLWRNIVASHLDDALWNTRKVVKGSDVADKMDVKRAKKVLGLDRAGGQGRAALEEMLKGTNVSVKEIETFLDIAEKATAQLDINVSQFVLRRAVLGGPRSIVNAALPFRDLFKSQAGVARGAAAAAGASGTVFAGAIPFALGAMATVGVRHLGKLLTDPGFVRDYIRLSKPGLSDRQAARVLGRLSRRMAVAVGASSTARQSGRILEDVIGDATTALAGGEEQ